MTFASAGSFRLAYMDGGINHNDQELSTKGNVRFRSKANIYTVRGHFVETGLRWGGRDIGRDIDSELIAMQL